MRKQLKQVKYLNACNLSEKLLNHDKSHTWTYQSYSTHPRSNLSFVRRRHISSCCKSNSTLAANQPQCLLFIYKTEQMRATISFQIPPPLFDPMLVFKFWPPISVSIQSYLTGTSMPVSCKISCHIYLVIPLQPLVWRSARLQPRPSDSLWRGQTLSLLTFQGGANRHPLQNKIGLIFNKS